MSLLHVVLACMVISLIACLDITNVTLPVKLTQIFAKESYSAIHRINPGSMSYYVDPTDPLKKKYLWYGVNMQTKESSDPTITSTVQSSVFTTEFTEYSNIDSLPFTVVNESSEIDVLFPFITQLVVDGEI
eukprot:382310_1